jgi:hypothetical protein
MLCIWMRKYLNFPIVGIPMPPGCRSCQARERPYAQSHHRTYFVGTRIEAFRGRGEEDYFVSHDREDLIAVVDAADLS